MFFKKKKVILIFGPTASGKSSLAIKLAKKKNGEIISVDSRQVFKEIPKFSGAVSEEEKKEIKHYFVGELSLVKNEKFDIAEFQKKALEKIDEILEKGKIPILVGGSSFFFEAIVYENFLPEIEPDFELRKELEKMTKEELFAEILAKDKKTAERIDKNNPARLIRAVEIIRKNGFVPEQKKVLRKKYDFEVYFLNPEKEILNERIKKNFLERVDGMLEEAEILRSKISAEKFQQLGLAYKNIFDF
jgi:tRNA dimethylallyltransferase